MCVHVSAFLRRRIRRGWRLIVAVLHPVAILADWLTFRLIACGVPYRVAVIYTISLIVSGAIISRKAVCSTLEGVPSAVAWISTSETFSTYGFHASGPILEIRIDLYPSLLSSVLCMGQALIAVVLSCAVCCHQACHLVVYYPLSMLLVAIATWTFIM